MKAISKFFTSQRFSIRTELRTASKDTPTFLPHKKASRLRPRDTPQYKTPRSKRSPLTRTHKKVFPQSYFPNFSHNRKSYWQKKRPRSQYYSSKRFYDKPRRKNGSHDKKRTCFSLHILIFSYSAKRLSLNRLR